MTILRDRVDTGTHDMGIEREEIHTMGLQRVVVKRRMERWIGRVMRQDLVVGLDVGYELEEKGPVYKVIRRIIHYQGDKPMCWMLSIVTIILELTGAECENILFNRKVGAKMFIVKTTFFSIYSHVLVF